VDGAEVKQGQLLFTLDGRTLEAQIAQTEGVLQRDKAQLEGAERDLRRYSELLAKGAGTQLNVENSKTQADMLRGTIKADEAALQNLRVQLSYTKIVAPITGRVSAANVKVGNFVRPADTAPLAVLNQIKPAYVAFAIPQRSLADLKQAVASDTARVEANVPGEPEPSVGKLAMIDNAVDATTGMVMVRALMPNRDEALWPGTLVNTELTLRTEDSVSVPAAAVQTGQAGTYVFVVKDGAAKAQPVKVARTVGGQAVIAQGLSGGETIVTDGQLLLADGIKVTPRPPRVGS
jgi:RND family efflux transporter MFP subunit